MIRVIEQRGTVELCCYPRNGWAVFEHRPTKPDEPDWKCVANGKFDDVWKKYVDAVKRSV